MELRLFCILLITRCCIVVFKQRSLQSRNYTNECDYCLSTFNRNYFWSYVLLQLEGVYRTPIGATFKTIFYFPRSVSWSGNFAFYELDFRIGNSVYFLRFIYV